MIPATALRERIIEIIEAQDWCRVEDHDPVPLAVADVERVADEIATTALREEQSS